ncbi:hypothetical protein MMC06_002769 [Schaereria dolodes]|nr:hypothetical protein [Schaereria dolodes]
MSAISLSSETSGTDQERRSFYFFRRETVIEFSGWFESSFWTHLVLQVSHAEPAVRHLTIALGFLHESSQHDDVFFKTTGHLDDRHQFALQQCNKAIGLLRTGLSTSTPQSVEITLIACVLFICFECFLGNHGSALDHLQSGLNILRNWRATHTSSSMDNPFNHPRISPASEADLVQLFTRLNLQAASFIEPRNLPFQGQMEELTPSRTVPNSFTSLNEARDCLVHHFDQSASIRLRFQLSYLGECSNGAQLPEANYAEPEEIYRLQQWFSQFDAYLTHSSMRMNTKDLQGAILLKIYHKVAYIIQSSGGSDNETIYDEFISDFEYINSLATSLVEVSKTTSSSSGRSSFSVDMGVVPPLYFTASKCRDACIRRRSISLLYSSRRREGVWNGFVTAKIAERLVAIEERDHQAPPSALKIFIPEWARIRVLKVTFNQAKQCVVLRYGQRRNGREGALHFEEEWISW